jgi:hypothetical protein
MGCFMSRPRPRVIASHQVAAVTRRLIEGLLGERNNCPTQNIGATSRPSEAQRLGNLSRKFSCPNASSFSCSHRKCDFRASTGEGDPRGVQHKITH